VTRALASGLAFGLAAALAAGAAAAVFAQQPATPAAAPARATPVDPLAPKTSAESAAIGPLYAITLSTSDLAGVLKLYRDGLGMRVRGPIPAAADVERPLWGLAPSGTWEMYLLDRPAAPGAALVRVLVFPGSGETIRATWNPQEPGPFTIGFPTADLPALDARLRRMGYESLAPMERSRIPRPDGSTYGLLESVFRGPDRVHVVLVSRQDGMPQLGPVDPATGHGGPAYSAQVVTDSDAVIAFYCQVLGLELRSDREWKSGERSAIGLPAGTPFRLALLYAPGATSGQLLLMDFRDRTAAPSGVAPRPPSRGIGIYTFPVKRLDDTAAQVRAAGAPVVHGPVTYDGGGLGLHRAMTVRAPNGVLVELVELQR
jgi:catechol 2,3-dioxygenase-like lactoylglutathione lyase family enzyme